MSILDIVPDYGERVDRHGEPVDEIFDVLTRFMRYDNPDIVRLAGEIARHRCDGRGDLEGALRGWRTYPEVLH